MRIPLLLPVALVWFLCSVTGTAAPVDAPAAVRVVSQTVGTDELLLALARPEQVAALSHLAAKPEFSAVAAQAAHYPRLTLGDAETVLRYAPTLVLAADYSRPELVAQLRRAGVRVLVFDRYRTLEDAYANLRLLARELDAGAQAEALIAACEARVADLRARLRGRRPVRVIAPSVFGVIPGDGTTFADLCAHAGAENLAATLGHLVGHAAAPSEQMLTWPLDFVVVMGEDPEEALAPFRGLVPYKLMPVIREGRAVLIAPHLMSCVSHLRIDGYEQLARQLHPEAFR
ncbi:MAG: ABC transporter substrate-binding protein [Opitutaceae bacterium]